MIKAHFSQIERFHLKGSQGQNVPISSYCRCKYNVSWLPRCKRNGERERGENDVCTFRVRENLSIKAKLKKPLFGWVKG